MKKVKKTKPAPKIPEQYIVKKMRKTYWELDDKEGLLLADFVAWADRITSVNATNIRLLLENECCAYDGDILGTNLVLTWDEITSNPKFHNQMKTYQKQLAKWQKEGGKQ